MPPRKLAHGDTFTEYLLSVITDDTTGDDETNEVPFGESGTVWLALEVTKDDWAKLFASVMTGADLIYNDEAHQVTWLLWRAAKLGTFCAQVASCITNNAATIAALDAWAANNPGGNGSPDAPLTDEVLGADMALVGCDNDKLWGSCVATIDGVMDASIEVLERFNLVADEAELVASVLGAIPIVGGLLSFAFELGAWGADIAYDLVIAADSAPNRSELACDLFCAIKDNCAITMNDVVDVFADNSISDPPFSTDLIVNLEWVLNTVFTGEPDKKVMSTIAMLGIFAMRHGGKFGQFVLGIYSIQQTVAMGAAVWESAGWVALCTECPETWEHEFVLGDGLDSWWITDWGTQQAGVGVVAESFFALTYQTAVRYLQNNTVIPSITSIAVTYTFTPGNSDYDQEALQLRTWTNVPPDAVIQSTPQSEMTTGQGEALFEFDDRPADRVRVLLRSRENNDDDFPVGTAIVKTITLTGNGADPYL